MSRFMTNTETLKLFKQIDELKATKALNDLPEEALDKAIQTTDLNKAIQTADIGIYHLTAEQKILAKEINIIQSKIIKGLSFLVYSNTKMYRKFPNYEDLVQEGFIGLLRAVRKFDCTLFPNFFVYSERWIRHSVKRAASRFDVVYNPNKSRVVYAESSEIGKEEETDDTPEEVFFEKEKGKRIEEVLGDFPDRDREIVKRVFGLGKYHPQTLREIGPMFDLTHERIRQIKNKVIAKLRKSGNLGELY